MIDLNKKELLTIKDAITHRLWRPTIETNEELKTLRILLAKIELILENEPMELN